MTETPPAPAAADFSTGIPDKESAANCQLKQSKKKHSNTDKLKINPRILNFGFQKMKPRIIKITYSKYFKNPKKINSKKRTKAQMIVAS